jgi:potassium/hydrogen antiporter
LRADCRLRLGIPGLLVFLAVGMLAGSDGPGGIAFDNADLAQTLGVVALAFILFAGGISTSWEEVRPVLNQGAALGDGRGADHGVDLRGGGELGVRSSDRDGVADRRDHLVDRRGGGVRGAAFTQRQPARPTSPVARTRIGQQRSDGGVPDDRVPRARHEPVQRTGRLHPVVRVADGDRRAARFRGRAGLATWGLNQIGLDHEGLYPVLLLAMVGFTFSLTTILNGSGFLAVYVAGIVMAQRRFMHKNSLTRFHDGIGWVAQIGMFVVLGLLVFPSELPVGRVPRPRSSRRC